MSIGLPSVTTYQTFVDNPKLKDFLGNIFCQVDVDKFMKIYKETVKSNQTSEEIYSGLLKRASEAKGGLFSRLGKGLKALKTERSTLAANVKKVMDPLRHKQGYVEIGMPGRMIKAIKPLMGLKGRVTVVNEVSSLIQSGWPHPYHEFQKLTYEPLSLKERSVDVISCFAGLHHCPADKLDAFAQSIHKTLRDGGTFLLREHDTKDSEMKQLANVIHSVFNAATGVTLADEQKEVRNFKSVADWKGLLKKDGFRCVSLPLVREGDSTQNALLKFVKVGDKEEQINVVREKLVSVKNNYTRPLEQSYMTTVEWLNVESAQNMGNVKNFWDYPFFRDAFQHWKTYFQSLKSARRAQKIGKGKVLTSEYMVVNSVIVTLTTVDYLAKGILNLPLWLLSKVNKILPKGKEDKNWERPAEQYQKWHQEYGCRLEVTPFYAQKYVPHIKSYWKTFGECWKTSRKKRNWFDMIFDRQTLKNLIVGIAMTIDMLARAIISVPINWICGGEANGDDRFIGVIVKGNIKKTDKMKHFVEDEDSPYKGVVVDRYKKLEEALRRFAKQGAEIVEIAGQKKIQVDMIVDKDSKAFHENKLYEYAFLPDKKKKVIALDVNVSDLPKYLNDTRFNRLHDY